MGSSLEVSRVKGQGNPVEVALFKGVPAEVILQGAVGCILQQFPRHGYASLHGEDVVEIVQGGIKALFYCQGVLPFFQEVFSEKIYLIYPACRVRGSMGGLTANTWFKPVKLSSEALFATRIQKFAPMENPARYAFMPWAYSLIISFTAAQAVINQGTQKETLVQVVAVSVVPHIQPEYSVAPVVKEAAGTYHVGGFCAPFPTVKEYN